MRRRDFQVVQNIGDIFAKASDSFISYSMYCSNHSNSLVKLDALMTSNRAARTLLEDTYKLPVCRGLMLNSFLIKPVQRICKYPLLLKDILKNSEDNPGDMVNLKMALEKLSTVITLVNDGARQADGVRKMLEIQSYFSEVR